MKYLYNYIFSISIIAGLFNYHIKASLGLEEQIAIKSRGDKEKILSQWFDAAQKGNIEVIKTLIGTVDVNAQNPNEITISMPGISGNLRDTTALIVASIYGHTDIVKFLLAVPGINVLIQAEKQVSALTGAALFSNEDTVKLLLQVPEIDINAQDIDGKNALMYAVMRGNENMATILLEVPGIDVNVLDKEEKWTALMIAAGVGCDNIVKLLLEIPGININAQDKGGSTALQDAKKFGNTSTVKLIEDAIEKLRNRAFKAIILNDVETLKSVIAQIGDKITDESGNTLIDKAFAANQPDIILFLLQNAHDPRKLLARFPFEAVQASSEIFKLCMELAYNKEPIAIGQKVVDKTRQDKSCASCAKQECAKLCSKCKKVFYCSVACQKSHWAEHKLNCEATAGTSKKKS